MTSAFSWKNSVSLCPASFWAKNSRFIYNGLKLEIAQVSIKRQMD